MIPDFSKICKPPRGIAARRRWPYGSVFGVAIKTREWQVEPGNPRYPSLSAPSPAKRSTAGYHCIQHGRRPFLHDLQHPSQASCAICHHGSNFLQLLGGYDAKCPFSYNYSGKGIESPFFVICDLRETGLSPHTTIKILNRLLSRISRKARQAWRMVRRERGTTG